MSGDQHNQADPPDLDAIEAWFEGKTQHSSLDDLSVIPEWHAVRDLVAEVRRLRAKVERVDALADDVWRRSQRGHTIIRDAGIMQDIVTELRAVLGVP